MKHCDMFFLLNVLASDLMKTFFRLIPLFRTNFIVQVTFKNVMSRHVGSQPNLPVICFTKDMIIFLCVLSLVCHKVISLFGHFFSYNDLTYYFYQRISCKNAHYFLNLAEFALLVLVSL